VNLSKHLNQQKTKERIAQIIQFVGTNKTRFHELISLFFEGNNRTSHTASWAVVQLAEENPQLIDSYHQKLVDLLADQKNPAGVRRNIARLNQT